MIEINIYQAENRAIYDAWINCTIAYINEFKEFSDYRVAVWNKLREDFGITDIPGTPKIMFENEETISLFILKYGSVGS